ncbi:hypothetical protein KCU67_g90, partial [Aureobasidium melanogenum]
MHDAIPANAVCRLAVITWVRAAHKESRKRCSSSCEVFFQDFLDSGVLYVYCRLQLTFDGRSRLAIVDCGPLSRVFSSNLLCLGGVIILGKPSVFTRIAHKPISSKRYRFLVNGYSHFLLVGFWQTDRRSLRVFDLGDAVISIALVRRNPLEQVPLREMSCMDFRPTDIGPGRVGHPAEPYTIGCCTNGLHSDIIRHRDRNVIRSCLWQSLAFLAMQINSPPCCVALPPLYVRPDSLLVSSVGQEIWSGRSIAATHTNAVSILVLLSGLVWPSKKALRGDISVVAELD